MSRFAVRRTSIAPAGTWASRIAILLLLLPILFGCRSTTEPGEYFRMIAIEGSVRSASGEPLPASVVAYITLDNEPGSVLGPVQLGNTRPDGTFSGSITSTGKGGETVTLTVRARPESDRYAEVEVQTRAVFRDVSPSVEPVIVHLIASSR